MSFMSNIALFNVSRKSELFNLVSKPVFTTLFCTGFVDVVLKVLSTFTNPSVDVVASVSGIFIVLSVAAVMCPVESLVICDMVAVSPNPGVRLPVGLPVRAVYVG